MRSEVAGGMGLGRTCTREALTKRLPSGIGDTGAEEVVTIGQCEHVSIVHARGPKWAKGRYNLFFVKKSKCF